MSFTCIPVQIEPNKSPLRKRLPVLLLWEIGHLSSPSRSCLGRLILIRGGQRGSVGRAPPQKVNSFYLESYCTKFRVINGQEEGAQPMLFFLQSITVRENLLLNYSCLCWLCSGGISGSFIRRERFIVSFSRAQLRALHIPPWKGTLCQEHVLSEMKWNVNVSLFLFCISPRL